MAKHLGRRVVFVTHCRNRTVTVANGFPISRRSPGHRGSLWKSAVSRDLPFSAEARHSIILQARGFARHGRTPPQEALYSK